MSFKKGMIPWNKGIQMSMESRLKEAQTKRKMYADGKLVPWNKGKPFMAKEKHPLYGKPRPPYVLQKMREGLERWRKINKFVPWNKGKKGVFSLEANLVRSYKAKNLWQNPDYRRKVIRNSLKGLLKRPTSLERVIIDLIRENRLPYEYCGNGTFLIGFKNPDFRSTNDAKVCIEVANNFHHNKLWKEERIKYFQKYGWRCLVLWWNEIFLDKYGKKHKEHWQEEILNKIKNFSASS